MSNLTPADVEAAVYWYWYVKRCTKRIVYRRLGLDFVNMFKIKYSRVDCFDPNPSAPFSTNSLCNRRQEMEVFVSFRIESHTLPFLPDAPSHLLYLSPKW